MDFYTYVNEIHQNKSFAAATDYALRIAVVVDDWKLDRRQTSHHDILDSFRLS